VAGVNLDEEAANCCNTTGVSGVGQNAADCTKRFRHSDADRRPLTWDATKRSKSCDWPQPTLTKRAAKYLHAPIRSRQPAGETDFRQECQPAQRRPHRRGAGRARVDAYHTGGHRATRSGRPEQRDHLAESTLGDASSLLQGVRELVVSAGNGGYSATDRTSVAQQMQSLRDQLFTLANRSDSNGIPCLALGQHQHPFTDTTAGVKFNGIAGQRVSTDVTVPGRWTVKRSGWMCAQATAILTSHWVAATKALCRRYGASPGPDIGDR